MKTITLTLTVDQLRALHRVLLDADLTFPDEAEETRYADEAQDKVAQAWYELAAEVAADNGDFAPWAVKAP